MKLPQTVYPVLLVAVAACLASPPQVLHSITASADLMQLRPIDVAVLPIEDATPGQTAGDALAAMRERIRLQLIRRRYTPLASVKIDEILAGQSSGPGVSVVDAGWLGGLGGKFGEDATLALRLTAWDTSSMMANGRVRFSADVRLVARGVAEPLWGGGIEGEVKAGGKGPAPRDRTDRLRAAAEQVAIRLIEKLPAREP